MLLPFDKFRFEGTDWCGPGWSDGKWQSNNGGYSTARSRFDQACKEHDSNLANHKGTKYSDLKFYKAVDNILVGAAPYIVHSIKEL